MPLLEFRALALWAAVCSPEEQSAAVALAELRLPCLLVAQEAAWSLRAGYLRERPLAGACRLVWVEYSTAGKNVVALELTLAH